jgi:hypothetical protein
MQLLIEMALVASVAYIIYLAVSYSIASRRNAAKAQKFGCEEPALQKNRYPLGIDNLLRAIAADKAKLFPVDASMHILEFILPFDVSKFMCLHCSFPTYLLSHEFRHIQSFYEVY